MCCWHFENGSKEFINLCDVLIGLVLYCKDNDSLKYMFTADEAMRKKKIWINVFEKYESMCVISMNQCVWEVWINVCRRMNQCMEMYESMCVRSMNQWVWEVWINVCEKYESVYVESWINVWRIMNQCLESYAQGSWWRIMNQCMRNHESMCAASNCMNLINHTWIV